MDKYINYNDRKLHYLDEGSGDVILFVHGFAEDNSVWQQFRQGISGYRHVVPDLPGFGGSDELKEEFTVESAAGHISAILEKEDIDKVHFVGHSLGGYVALAFAEKYPAKLKSLTMFHSHPYMDDEPKKQNRLRSVDLVEKYGTEVFIREMYQNLFTEDFAKSHPDFMNERIAIAQRYPATAIQAAQLAMVRRPDRSEVLRTIKVPVLFIIGKEDKAIPYENSLRQTHLPDVANVNILEGVAHMGMFEKEEECREILKGFVNESGTP